MYRWDDMGLKNIWLAHGYTLHDTSYGHGVSFKDVEGLTRAGKSPARSPNGRTAWSGRCSKPTPTATRRSAAWSSASTTSTGW